MNNLNLFNPMPVYTRGVGQTGTTTFYRDPCTGEIIDEATFNERYDNGNKIVYVKEAGNSDYISMTAKEYVDKYGRV